MAVRTDVLCKGVILTAAYAPLFPGPVGYTVLIKQLTVTNGNAAAQTFDVRVTAPGPAIYQLLWKISVPANSTIQYPWWAVLEQNEWFEARASVAAALTFWAFGARLAGVAP